MKKMVKIIILTIAFAALPAGADLITELHNLGYIVVSPNGPDDGGDYGPHTPGTQTSGMQEAFNYAKNNIREVYIIGGGVDQTGGNPVVYNLSTSLHIPWGQDWHNDGGNYIMNFTQTSGDCLVIDSQMNCQFNFGVVQAPNLQSGALVSIHPTSVGPDNFVVVVSSIIKICAIQGNGNGYGLHINPSGGLVYSHISIGEISNCNKGIVIDGGEHLTISCPLIRRCTTGLDVNSGRFHIVDVFVDPEDLGGTPVGVELGADEGIFRLGWEPLSYSAGNYLVLPSNSQNNLIYAMNLPTSGMTNSATKPNNRIVPLSPVGFSIVTPSVPASGSYVTNTTGYPVMITITAAGSVTSCTIRDANGTTDTVSGALFAGQSIYLDAGDAVSFSYSGAPSWTWQGLR